MPMLTALMDSLESPMRFNTDTLDKGGKLVALSLHGNWMAPAQCFDQPDVMLLIGINPIVTFTGLPTGNPGHWLKLQKKRGMKLIVVDPRRTQVSRQADLHLRPKPGMDVAIIASLIHVIIKEQRFDKEFTSENISGLETLRLAVAPFSPNAVAKQTNVEATDLISIARTFAGQSRGYVMAGTGPHMSGSGTLTEYLLLALQSLCGYWLRAGDAVTATPTLLPPRCYKAQAQGPDENWCFGEALGYRGLRETQAGLPIIELPTELIRDDKHRIRALVCVGGNPVAAIPDRKRTVRALKNLDLYVQIDPWMSQSASMADYVLAPKMPLETAGNTQVLDMLTGWTGYGVGVPYANHTMAVVPPPEKSEVRDDWQFLYGLAQRLGFDSMLLGKDGKKYLIDKNTTTEALLTLMANGARVSLDSVRANRTDKIFPEPRANVLKKDPLWTDRFNVGNTVALTLLAEHKPQTIQLMHQHYPLRLICRRNMHAYNSSCHVSSTHRSKAYNPAFLSPEDMQKLQLDNGEIIILRSACGRVYAIAETDKDLQEGLVSMAFAYGGDDVTVENVTEIGTDPNLLIQITEDYDPFTGQPRMSNVPVAIEKIVRA